IGLILIYLIRLLIFAFGLRCTLSFKDPAYRALGIVLAVYLGLGITGQIMLNATAGLYYWGALGLLLAMRQFEQSARKEAGTMFAPSRTRLAPSAIHSRGSPN